MPERRIVTLPNGDLRYCVIGERMAVDFHIVRGLRDFDPIAGLECHYFSCPSYMGDRAPDFDHCWLTGGACWCDGTSLYATEWLLPMFDEKDVERFWPVLENELRKRDRDAFGENDHA